MAQAMHLTEFSLLSSLAPELRSQIWHQALPDSVGSTLYTYKPGCFGPREFEEGDVEYDETGEILVMEWRHDLLDDSQFAIPLFFFNREATAIFF